MLNTVTLPLGDRHHDLPIEPNYSFSAIICGKRIGGRVRLPETQRRFAYGTRLVFKELSNHPDAQFTFADMEADNRFVWTKLKPSTNTERIEVI
jgi:hypothetical protein